MKKRKKDPDSIRTRFLAGADKVVVQDMDSNEGMTRILTVNGVRESATYIDPDNKNELVFDYLKDMDRVFSAIPEARETLLIGGAGFSYPKYYISHYPKKSMDVVEINEYMYNLAIEYFFLRDLYEEYNLSRSERLRIFIDEGFHYLAVCRRRYDVILNDAYRGSQADPKLLSSEGAALIFRCLKPNGVYILNLITAVTGPRSMSGIMAKEILKTYFNHVELYPCDIERNPFDVQNCIIVSSDERIEWEPD